MLVNLHARKHTDLNTAREVCGSARPMLTHPFVFQPARVVEGIGTRLCYARIDST